MRVSNTLFVFNLILVAAFLFSLLLAHIPLLRIPSAISYVLFGMLLSSAPFRLSSAEILWLNEIGNCGLLFLMFLSGMEVDITLLRPDSWKSGDVNPFYAALSIFLGTFLFSFGCSLLVARFSPQYMHPYMLTLLFATTSLGVIVPILEEAKLLHTAYGQTLLLSALLADFFTMLLVSVFVSVRTSRSSSDLSLSLAILPGAVALYFLMRRIQKSKHIRSWVGDAQARMRATLALVAAACAFANFSGSEPILGSFLVGMLVSAIPFAWKTKLKDYSHGIGYGLLVPIFFISVGLNFQFELFRNPAAWTWVPVLLVMAFVVKMVPSWQMRRFFGLRKTVAGGILLSARLGLIVAAAEIGVRLGALPEFIGESVILVAVLTSLLSPIVFVSLLQNA